MNESLLNQAVKYVLDGETVNRKTTVSLEGNTVTKHHVTEHKTGKVECDWTFDFSNVTQEELLELASRDLVIKMRPKFKAIKSSDIPEWKEKTFNVREFLDGAGRSTLSDSEKFARLAGKLSKDEVAQLLKEAGHNI